jgi:hypothetical protein
VTEMDIAEEKWKVLARQLETYGYACATVKDGTLFLFSQAVLQGLLDRCKTNESGVVTVLIQNPMMN